MLQLIYSQIYLQFSLSFCLCIVDLFLSLLSLLINQHVAPAEPAEVLPDSTAYYNDFWLYVSYYGEAAARAYYTQWAPPEGTLPPKETPLPAAPLPQERVPEPVGEAENYYKNNNNNSSSVRVAEATPPIDPAIAAAYEEFKIEVRHLILLSFRYLRDFRHLPGLIIFLFP
jgi:hypothetical protein